MARHVIAAVDELPPGTRKFLTIDERPIAVFNIKGEFFGLLNRCPHQGAALCEGPLPLARLGIRHPYRAILLRPETVSRAGLSGQCRTGRERGEGTVCGRDHRGVGGKRLRGGGIVKPLAVIPGRCAASNPESRDSGFALRAPRNDGMMVV
jgi:hypothetical protein